MNMNEYKIISDAVAHLIITNNNGEHIVLIDTEDLPKIKEKQWNINANGYARTTWPGDKYVMMPHVIYGRKLPKPYVFDHINGDKLDNRKCNLQPITNWLNHCIRTKKKGIRGVFWDGRYYRYRDHTGKMINCKNETKALEGKTKALAKQGKSNTEIALYFDIAYDDISSLFNYFNYLDMLRRM